MKITSSVSVETCENCGRLIGKLETPMVWQDHVVCAECNALLMALPVKRQTEIVKLKTESKNTQTGQGYLTDVPQCPYCGSIHVSSGAKGFGGGKALTGLVLLGPLGLLAGALGSGKTKITCLQCGKTFAPGDTAAKLKKLKRKNDIIAVVIIILFIIIFLIVAVNG
ncbi:MAG: hypothetical protein ACP5I8_12170 [Phycisphaerae bacterium]